MDGRPGHLPADPRILLTLWLNAAVQGIGSAREVAKFRAEHFAFQWLCGEVEVNAKTLAGLRVDHGDVAERLLIDSFIALVRAGVASLDGVAQEACRCGPRRGGIASSAFDLGGMTGQGEEGAARSARES